MFVFKHLWLSNNHIPLYQIIQLQTNLKIFPIPYPLINKLFRIKWFFLYEPFSKPQQVDIGSHWLQSMVFTKRFKSSAYFFGSTFRTRKFFFAFISLPLIFIESFLSSKYYSHIFHFPHVISLTFPIRKSKSQKRQTYTHPLFLDCKDHHVIQTFLKIKQHTSTIS